MCLRTSAALPGEIQASRTPGRPHSGEIVSAHAVNKATRKPPTHSRLFNWPG